MKIALPVLLILALAMCIFNLTQVDWATPFEGKSGIALIGTMASASAFLLISILMI